jgi:2-keto-3-deoxy-L-rhamnonate aldolase RhmA
LKKNRLRDLINKGEPTLSTRILISWPGLVEIIGFTEIFDYVEFVSEYAPYDLYDFENLARAAELVGISSMIKIDQEPRTFLAERALAAGIQNVLFADIRNVEDAKEAVCAVRAEPKGLSGFRMDRRVGYVSTKSSPSDVVKMSEESIVALMIEKKGAIERLEEILSVEGVDMVQFGPADYAISIGLPGERNHSKVREAEYKTIKTALKFDVSPRAEIRNSEEAKKYIKLGVRNFSIGIDVKILYDFWKKNGNKLRKILTRR